jgi:hypothetical protein
VRAATTAALVSGAVASPVSIACSCVHSAAATAGGSAGARCASTRSTLLQWCVYNVNTVNKQQ